ncbi:heavy metal translocating P-type ATPase [Galbitalea soli]|uniref:Cadmium-translocating P-type ATPase n=1 Tax=Galbitalea soli TaxID=1268042 RepID=A0A7C9PNJ8_9MICO|nr:heavy metal translocating P-type ATPase [Galbitalea soli]NEM91690.1 cadmium-translocating P-type ATPase [Galbitalea soli]NYJ30386.1 heavy metal translocating P-type ATPase [Galbitalea soli]
MPARPSRPPRTSAPPRAIRLLLRYPILDLAAVVALVAGVLALSGNGGATRWVVSGFAVIVAAYLSIGMVRGLLRRHWGIDILAVIAIVATIVVGEYWAGLVIVVMLAGGRALEDYAGRRARAELTALLARAPQFAHVLVDGTPRDLAIEEVRIGDSLVVRPGEVVPVDCVLLSAEATVDASQLTGESVPVEHAAGAQIPSGVVNLDGAISVRATQLAADSQYQRVVELVRAASESRAPLVRLADRYSVPFTAISLGLAGIAWWISGDPVRFAEVLVVATPCPLLIAAPIAFVAGVSRAARSGIIVKGGVTLEVLSRVRTAAFDKTGTLTFGSPEVVDTVVEGAGRSPDDLLRLIASVEQYSGHVLAGSIVRAAAERGLGLLAATEAAELTGRGVTARVDGHEVAVGKRAFIEGLGAHVDSPPPTDGSMAVYAAVDGRSAGHVVLADRVRPNTAETLRALAAQGVGRTIMLTGDLAATASAIAAQAGIGETRAECLPEDKVRAVASEPMRPVMMVGDGVNDAPVLAASDVGVAMGSRGATAASESADVVIMVDDLSRLVRAVTIGSQSTAIATQAIWMGIVISIALMLVAMTGVLPAIVGALLQEGVDVLTILYALRAVADRPDRRLAGLSTL